MQRYFLITTMNRIHIALGIEQHRNDINYMGG